MKVMLGAAVAVLLMTVAAAAQTEGTTPAPAAPAAPAQSACGAVPERPTLPDGATADRAAMDAANAAFTAWGEAARVVLVCRRDEVTALGERRESLAAQYNAGAQTLNATNTSWEAEVTEFNARPANNRRR